MIIDKRANKKSNKPSTVPRKSIKRKVPQPKLSLKERFVRRLPIICIIAGVSILLALLAFGLYSKQKQSETIGTYVTKTTKNVNQDKIDAEINKAKQYNTTIANMNASTTEIANNKQQYNTIFSDNNGIIGVLVINKIDVKLPIYHGTSETALARGVGHVEDTAFPIGTHGTKSILTGHNGVPGADMLFTRLDEMHKGDTFYIRIARYEYKYRVKKIRDITPEQAEKYAQQQNKSDKNAEVTLITCTPYGVNTRRLLVTGYFVKRTIAKNVKIKTPFSMGIELRIIIGVIVIGLITLTIIIILQHKQSKALNALLNDDSDD